MTILEPVPPDDGAGDVLTSSLSPKFPAIEVSHARVLEVWGLSQFPKQKYARLPINSEDRPTSCKSALLLSLDVTSLYIFIPWTLLASRMIDEWLYCSMLCAVSAAELHAEQCAGQL